MDLDSSRLYHLLHGRLSYIRNRATYVSAMDRRQVTALAVAERLRVGIVGRLGDEVVALSVGTHGVAGIGADV